MIPTACASGAGVVFREPGEAVLELADGRQRDVDNREIDDLEVVTGWITVTEISQAHR
jgi:hypothetical protein